MLSTGAILNDDNTNLDMLRLINDISRQQPMFIPSNASLSQLGEVMISMASNLMLADERVLWMAQREASACSRIIACLQKIAVYRLATAQAFSLVSPNTCL